ncbi:MAG: hypothetical protein JNL08_10560 [Planctomycetes bacterium]|nr:hypothetical protein [Planctomycetota bacterium]
MTVRARWTTFGIALATSAVLVGVGCTLRGAEVDAEYDRYHVVAEQFWQGHVLFDRFHPFGYPLLVAALLPVVGDSLLAGVVVSALAAGLLVWAVGSLAERLRAGAGVPAASLAAVNGWLWVFGTMASTDAAATASMTAALAIVAHGGEWRHRRALAGGVCAGFAVACRFASAAVVPVGAVWAWWRGGLRGAALFALGALVGYLPHAVVATWTTGAPLGNDNWHLLYLKAVCGYEIECLQRTYEAGTLPSLTAFLGQHGGELLRLGAVDLASPCGTCCRRWCAGHRPVRWRWRSGRWSLPPSGSCSQRGREPQAGSCSGSRCCRRPPSV